MPTVPDSRDAMQVDTDGEAEFMDEQQDSQRRMLMEDQKSNPMSSMRVVAEEDQPFVPRREEFQVG